VAFGYSLKHPFGEEPHSAKPREGALHFIIL